MFLINSNIKRVLCLVIFSTVFSSNVNALASDTKITPTSKTKKVFSYIYAGVIGLVKGAFYGALIPGLLACMVGKDTSLGDSLITTAIFAVFPGAITGSVISVKNRIANEKLKAKIIEIQDYIEVQQVLAENNQENQKEFSFLNK